MNEEVNDVGFRVIYTHSCVCAYVVMDISVIVLICKDSFHTMLVWRTVSFVS